MNRGKRVGGRFVTISMPSSEIMQASTSERWAWPPNVPTDETPLCRLLAATAQGVRTDPGGVLVRMVMARTPPPQSGGAASSGFTSRFFRGMVDQSPPTRAKYSRGWFFPTTLRPRRTTSIGIVHNGMHMTRAARSTAF
jgi:hypothetical protein